ncbi:EAL domain-containing protein [Blastococcus tunisiensis]|uniref:EAL domain, c-di-GMP-specific phosphodiesterase class I (Or its enzymatically inactive variant) n=1 Tax=Blastococcus tunisiensis TaxID=1798228 RepID=A0A1I2EEK9_9ACTN|nr:EAL domain-containing protein [Blastococcus sp. DSM 46838]SFE91392.1 EAL domain, c-di-GMP-specific phosphodiesterase class I (or its enzymatically inactive variant) [Blastococcus sp. DSM 46838]
MGTICGGVCGCRQNWPLPGPATRALLATSVGHVLPTVSRLAKGMGLAVSSAPQLVDIADERGGRRLETLFHRLARELTAAETEAVRVVTDPPAGGAALTVRLLTAPTLAVELARRGVTVEVGVLAEAELWSVYQPIVSLADRSEVAHEALLRGYVDGREVGGGDLFFVAEQAGWLDRLDRIGRESAITGAAGWLGRSDLFINVHPTSIYRPQVCLASTERAAHDAGIAPGQLVVEVVESHAIADRGHLVSVLEHYRSLGWRVALDHVAAGWSSLSLLAAVRPEVVKLDKGLVQELPDAGARTVLRALVDLAHQLGAVVVAEGVETEQLADEVADLGADLGQGWLFGRPVRPDPPVEELEGRWQPVVPARR